VKKLFHAIETAGNRNALRKYGVLSDDFRWWCWLVADNDRSWFSAGLQSLRIEMISGCKAMLTCGKKKVAIVGFYCIVTVCYDDILWLHHTSRGDYTLTIIIH